MPADRGNPTPRPTPNATAFCEPLEFEFEDCVDVDADIDSSVDSNVDSNVDFDVTTDVDDDVDADVDDDAMLRGIVAITVGKAVTLL